MKIAVLDRCTVTNGDVSLDEIDSLGEVLYYDIIEPERIPEIIGDAEAIVCNKAKITRDIMDKCPKLKYIGLFATGYNNIDISAANDHGITVCNVPGYSTDSVAQHVFAMILQFAVHLAEYDSSVHCGDWVRSKKFSYFSYPISELSGKTLGIYGLGAIGQKSAEIGNAFGMKVIACTRTPKKVSGVTLTDKDTLFKESDYLTLHCPLTPETEKLVNSQTLALMKPSSVIINTARGAVIDEDALCEALNSDKIAGAGIDVLNEEPMPENHPYLTAKNCIITPHIGWAAYESRTRLMHKVAENIRAYKAGSPVNTVNNLK